MGYDAADEQRNMDKQDRKLKPLKSRPSLCTNNSGKTEVKQCGK